MRRLIAVLLILAVSPLPVRAWNAAGHMTVTKLAWDQLDAKDRQTLYELLKDHPHWDRFFLKGGAPKDVPEMDYRMALASTWPDWLRGFAKSTNEEDKKVYRFHKGPKHYINWPFVNPPDVEMFQGKNAPTTDPKDDIVKGLTSSMDDLKNPERTTTKQRAVSLCWLLHLAGDVHQPLHNVSFYSAEVAGPAGDQGGNLFWVKDGGVPTRLHAYWDDLFGKEDYDAHVKAYDRAVTACALLTRPDFTKDRFENDLKTTTFEAWSKEGFRLAKEIGYRNAKLPGRLIQREHETEEEKSKAPPLPDDYRATATATANRQAALAGHRLAGLLKEVAAATRKGQEAEKK